MGRREEKKAQTRAELIAAAVAVFAKRGFAAASLDEVAQVAGLTKGAVYSNFASKAELALAVLDRRITEPIALFERVAPHLHPDAQFERAAALLTEELDLAVAWFRLELECTVAAMADPTLLAHLRARDRTMRSALADALEARLGLMGSDGDEASAAIMANGLVALVNGIALERMKDETVMPAELVAQMLRAVQASFLEARGGSGRRA